MTTLLMDIVGNDNLQAFLDRCERYGRDEARGKNSRPDWAMDLLSRARAGMVGTKDAKAVWASVKRGMVDEASFGLEKDAKPSDSDTPRVSETNRLIKMGALRGPVNGPEVMQRAVEIINEGEYKGSTINNMLKVATAQNKVGDDHPLSDDEIKECLAGQAKKDRSELEILEGYLKQLRKTYYGSEKDPDAVTFPSAELFKAIKNLEERVDAINSEEEAIRAEIVERRKAA